MSRIAKFALSGLTALSLSLAPMEVSAAPDGEDIAKALAGLAVIGIVASTMNDRKQKRKSEARGAVPVNPYATIEGPRAIEGEIRRPGEKKNRFHGVRQAALPDRCVRIVSTDRGDRTAYSARCLQREYIYADQLPAACQVQVQTNDRVRLVYGARCLQRDGWRVAGGY